MFSVHESSIYGQWPSITFPPKKEMSSATHRSCVENEPTNIFPLSEIWFKHKGTLRLASYFEPLPSTQPQFSQENDQAHLSASSGFSENVHRLGIPQTSDALFLRLSSPLVCMVCMVQTVTGLQPFWCLISPKYSLKKNNEYICFQIWVHSFTKLRH